MLFLTLNNQVTAKKSDAAGTTGRERSNPVRMSGKFFARAMAVVAAAGMAAGSWAGVIKEGNEYRLADALEGDQVRPDLALAPGGGYLAWEDNSGDGDGLSVNFRRINATLSGQFEVTQLATITTDNQERPKVAMLADGGAAFVWQGGPDGAQKVYLRMMTPGGTFFGDELAVSGRSDINQKDAAVVGLPNGNVVVVWAADGQDGSMQGVFARVYGPSGQEVAGEFQVNQYSLFNQRSPVVAALPDSKFVIGWISENQRFDSSVDLYARLFTGSGSAVASEFRVNTADRVASSPAIAVTGTGNYTFAWCEISQDSNLIDGVQIIPNFDLDGWDIYASTFNVNGRLSNPSRINSTVAGNQRNPSIAAIGTTHLVVWSSIGQDGSGEGVIGRALSGIGSPDGAEFVVNSTTLGGQRYPTVRGNGDSRFLVSWSSFAGLAANMELMGQRFQAEQTTLTLPAAPAPSVAALTQSRLSVTWPAVAGYDVMNYELYVNGNLTPLIVTNQMKVVTGLTPSSTHSFELAYRLRDGQLSPRSPAASGTTWGEDINEDGLPDDWQAIYWTPNQTTWPSIAADSDGDGVSNQKEYLAGTNPTDANSVLKTKLVLTPQGWRFQWNTTPGFIYQVQTTTDLSTWVDFGGQRFAPGVSDSVSVPVGNSLGYYRVNRIR